MKRLFFFLFAATAALADRYIETSALLPCQISSDFTAKKFNVKFYPDTSKVSLDVEIASAIDGNFTVDVEVLVYGIKAFTKTITGCDISKTVCPISPGRFDVQTELDIDSSIVDQIPGIAYTFPDIDATVQAKVYYVDENGAKKSNVSTGCVIAQLSNGKTVKHSYVSWIMFGIIVAGIVVSGFAMISGQSTTASHIISNTVSLFSYFQSTAIIGMMAVVRMPPIASAWVENFEWTMGIISVGFMQKAVTWYVRATGGTENTILANTDLISIAVYKRAAEPMQRLMKRDNPILDSNVTTTNENEQNLLGKTLVLQGIKRVSYLANIELSNFFVTGAAFFIFIGLAIVIILFLWKAILELLVYTKCINGTSFNDYRSNYRSYTKGVMFRYFLVGFTQLSLLCLWEFTSRESVATVVIACVMFAILLITLSFAATRVIILGHKSKSIFKNPASILFGNPEVFHRWGFLYVQYNSSAYYFLVLALVYNFAKSAVIALGQHNGKAQSIVFFIIEVIYFILLCCIRPYMNKTMNGYNIAISVFSIVNAIFYMFFAKLFSNNIDVAAAIIGVVYFLMNAILCCIFLILIIVACLLAIFHPHPDTRYKPVTDDRNMFMPDAADEKEGTELDDMRNAARDGYRQSYLSYDPASGHQNFGVARRDNSPDKYHDADAPSSARHNFNGVDPDDSIQSYRDVQSRGVLGDRPDLQYKPNDRLI